MTRQLGDRDHRLRTHGDHESYIVQELQEPSPLLFDSEERKVLFSGVRSPILVADTPEEDKNNTNATELKECRALIGELQEPSPLLFDSEERTTACITPQNVIFTPCMLFSGVRSPILLADTPEEDTNDTNSTELKECRALIGIHVIINN